MLLSLGICGKAARHPAAVPQVRRLAGIDFSFVGIV